MTVAVIDLPVEGAETETVVPQRGEAVDTSGYKASGSAMIMASSLHDEKECGDLVNNFYRDYRARARAHLMLSPQDPIQPASAHQMAVDSYVCLSDAAVALLVLRAILPRVTCADWSCLLPRRARSWWRRAFCG